MRNPILTIGLAASALVVAGTAFAQQGFTQTVWDGVYTAEQAARGEAAYAQRCGTCHGGQLNGTGEAPALVGGEFISHYNELSVGDLFDRVRTTMPMDNPQSLDREEYADILAFLLKANSFPAGETALDRRSEMLAMIEFIAQKPDTTASNKGAEQPTP
ncbi:hypothetical protein GCM10007973_12350 [Polymorphobacter multimanifer]|uniref:Mono/diheme cytochrome c family protein n=1 Tax=Polymorphobacter multimanifer TaxID=1070431 RepID=A0A841L8U0_9SPHN|nr:cytochrome c [Polymorphobacter multimanifer]MBB6229057.1 mono/diheme cytochrome c family protein [Polymorphobacter multimanifer]GGI77043.1 hypothetical protein GCM10007973_12350 [Polymorphobacter multimanifer]